MLYLFVGDAPWESKLLRKAEEGFEECNMAKEWC